MNEFTVEPTLAAGTDWVINFPTKRFYVDSDIDTDPDTDDLNYLRPFTQDFKAGGACEEVSINIWDREEQTTALRCGLLSAAPGRQELAVLGSQRRDV
jgi:hypothetical protein